MDTTLKQGSIGEAVKQLQLGLIALGYDVGKNTQADGKFGPATAAGVRKFQSDNGLPVTGIWTPEDQNALDNALADENGPPANDDVDEAALLTELEENNKRQAVIIAALKGVL
jgi:peptidoglycan hydrolase-like protein with peptidoglycan-binding domain